MYATAEHEADIRTVPVRHSSHHPSHRAVHRVPNSARSRPMTAERVNRYDSPSSSSYGNYNQVHPQQERYSSHTTGNKSLTTSSSRPFSALERTHHHHNHDTVEGSARRKRHTHSESRTNSASLRVNAARVLRKPAMEVVSEEETEALEREGYDATVQDATSEQLRRLTHHHTHHHPRDNNNNIRRDVDMSESRPVSRGRSAGRQSRTAGGNNNENIRGTLGGGGGRKVSPARAAVTTPSPARTSRDKALLLRSSQHSRPAARSRREEYTSRSREYDTRRAAYDDDDEVTDIAGLTSYRTPPRHRSPGQNDIQKNRAARNGYNSGPGRATAHMPSPLRMSREDDWTTGAEEQDENVTGGTTNAALKEVTRMKPHAASQTRMRCEGSFRVRLHRAAGLFAATLDIAAVPALFVSLHTRDERAHSSTVSGQLSPVFNDEFVFSSRDVERDALACTVVALTHAGSVKRVAECVVSLKYLLRHVSRQVWVPLVRHAGTSEAYIRGELLLSLYSTDYGLHTMPSEEDEVAFRNELQHLLVKYAPVQLHRLDWLVGEYLTRDEAARARLRSYLQEQQQQREGTPQRDTVRASKDVRTTIEVSPERPVKAAAPPPISSLLPTTTTPEEALTKTQDVAPALSFSVTLGEVTDLTEAYGRPANISTCYIVLHNPQGNFHAQTKAVPYLRRALLDESFTCPVRDPRTESLSLTLFSATRKIGEAALAFGGGEVALGKPRQVQLMLVRAAATGDAATAGFLSLTLRLQRPKTTTTQRDAESLSQRLLPSRNAEDEARLRQRVLGYLWQYLRDDLHRLDVIVTGMVDSEAQMREWSKTIGPEPVPRHVTLELREAHDVGLTGQNASVNANTSAANTATSTAAVSSFVGFASVPCYVRVLSGPYLLRTPSSIYRDGSGVLFQSPLSVTLFDPSQDALELLLIAETASGDREVGRAVIGVANLRRSRAERRTIHLVANALTAEAHIQGELIIELLAEDFGIDGFNDTTQQQQEQQEPSSEYYSNVLESLMERNAPEQLHRVPYMLSCARDQAQLRQLVEAKSREFGNEVAAAPMTVRVLGLREFRPCCDCYVKVYLNNTPLLRTKDKPGGSATVTFDIADDNEQTVMLSDARHAVLTLKVGQHKALRKSRCISVTELVLSSMIRGEVNTLWIPIFADSEHGLHRNLSNHKSRESSSITTNNNNSSDRAMTRQDRAAIQRNVLPAAVRARVGGIYGSDMNGFSTSNISNTAAAPLGLLGVELQSLAFTQTTVTLYKETGQNGETLSAHAAVTRDVTTLLTKYQPRDLNKVQPLIAAQPSLREAHSELRARICPRPADATVYLHIDAIDMVSVEGRQLEEQGAIALEASFYDERQQARKTADFANDAIHRRVYYPTVRLDLVNPQPRMQDDTTGDNVLRSGVLPGDAMGIGDESRVMPPLVLKLLRVGTAAQGGRNDFLAMQSISPGRSGAAQDRGMSQSLAGASKSAAAGAGTTSPARHRHTSLDVRHHGNRMDSFLEPGAALSTAEGISITNGTTTTTAADARWASLNNNSSTLASSNATSATMSFVRNGLIGGVGGMRSELGTVMLSLRGLLCSGLYKPGSPIRVPIVACNSGERFDLPRTSAAASAILLSEAGSASVVKASTTTPSTSSPSSFSRVVGTVTLRLTAPAFEKYPEWLKLTRRALLAELEPDFVHYYERRLGGCLRTHGTAELARMHYDVYELHVARGVWPLSLPRWLSRLHEQLGESMDYYQDGTTSSSNIPPVLAPSLLQAAELRLRGLESTYKQQQQQQVSGQDAITHTNSIHSTVLQPNSAPRSTRRELSPEYSLGDLPEVLSVDGVSRSRPSATSAAVQRRGQRQPKASNECMPDVRLSTATSVSRRSGAEAGKAAAAPYAF